MEAITLAQTSHGTASARDEMVGVLMLDAAVIVLMYAPLQRKSCAVKKWIQDTLNGHSFVMPFPVLFIPGDKDLAHAKKRIRRWGSTRLKVFPGLPFICLDTYILFEVYKRHGICVRNHCGAEPPRDI